MRRRRWWFFAGVTTFVVAAGAVGYWIAGASSSDTGNPGARTDTHAPSSQSGAPIDVAISNVRSDLMSLQADEAGVDAAVRGIPAVVQGTSQDLATAASDQQQIEAALRQHLPTTCGQLAGDALQVDADAGEVNAAAADVESALQQLRHGLSQLQVDAGTLASGEAQAGSRVRTAPSKAKLFLAVVMANATISSALSMTNGSIDEVNADVATAYQYAAQAYTAAPCGAATQVPPPSPHIA